MTLEIANSSMMLSPFQIIPSHSCNRQQVWQHEANVYDLSHQNYPVELINFTLDQISGLWFQRWVNEQHEKLYFLEMKKKKKML